MLEPMGPTINVIAQKDSKVLCYVQTYKKVKFFMKPCCYSSNRAKKQMAETDTVIEIGVLRKENALWHRHQKKMRCEAINSGKND